MNNLPKMSSTVSTPELLSGNIGAKTINIKGDDGATFVPSVSTDGIISWTNDKDLPNPEPVNIKGEKGDNGTTNYSDLENKPSINGVELSGNKTGEELGLVHDLSGYATKDEIPVVPEALPNPNALTFTGAVNATYDGSKAVEVNIPSGGGGGEEVWRLIREVTTTEEVASVEISTDEDGQTFSLKKIWCRLKIQGSDTNTANDYLRVNLNEPTTAARILDVADFVQNKSTRERHIEIQAEPSSFKTRLNGFYIPVGSSIGGNGQMYSLIDAFKMFKYYKTVDSIYVYSKNGGVFGEGTKVELWGVDA